MSEWKQKKKHSGMYKYYNTLISIKTVHGTHLFSKQKLGN